MLNKFLYIILITAAAVFVSCSGSSSTGNADSAGVPESAAAGPIPLPDVPDSLTDPADRADYLLAHFWDGVDFADNRVMSDSIMIEQGMSDFISVMDFCSDSGLDEGVGRLLDKASSASPEAYSKITSLARLYLWDAESPFRSERFYTPFAQYAVNRGGDEALKGQAALDDIRRNAPGSPAPDFTVTAPDGSRLTLASALGTGAPVALMFYAPDCDHCEEAIASLTSDAEFARLIDDGRLRFMAVYIGDKYGQWKEHAAGLPRSWRIGIDRERVIDDRDLYLVKATPSFYIIDSDGRILLKDSGIDGFYRSLAEIMRR